MDFLGIGPWEVLLILVLALIIMGPGKITDTARTLGKIVRAIRKASTDFTTTITRELDATRNEPPPSPPKAESKAKNLEASLAISQAEAPSPDNQHIKPGGAPSVK